MGPNPTLMKNPYALLAGFLMTAAFISCTRETAIAPEVPTDSFITGNYRLYSIRSSTETRNENSYQGIPYVVNSQLDYSSCSNSGSLQFTNGMIAMSGLGYNISDSIQFVYYKNGTVTNTERIPFTDSVPAASASVPFRVISEDSIYFPAGSPMGALPTGAGAVVANGARFSRSGDTLTLETSFLNDSSFQVDGSPVRMYQNSRFTTRFIRQD
jgi:hypothetical protein